MELFNNRSGTSRHAKDPALPKLLTLLDGLPLAITLIAARASEENTIEEVINLWSSQRTAYSDDGQLLTREESIRCSLDLSLASPLITDTPHAKDLLTLLALLPVRVSYRRLQSEGLDDLLSSATAAVLSTSLASLTSDSTERTLRLLAPVAEYLRDRSSGIEAPCTEVLRLVALSYFDDCKTLPVLQGRLPGIELPSDFLNFFEIFVLAEHIADQPFQEARANTLLDLIERFGDDNFSEKFTEYLRRVRWFCVRLLCGLS
jgi:hypothetical protein